MFFDSHISIDLVREEKAIERKKKNKEGRVHFNLRGMKMRRDLESEKLVS
jgi:hypothetical protein